MEEDKLEPITNERRAKWAKWALLQYDDIINSSHTQADITRIEQEAKDGEVYEDDVVDLLIDIMHFAHLQPDFDSVEKLLERAEGHFRRELMEEEFDNQELEREKAEMKGGK